MFYKTRVINQMKQGSTNRRRKQINMYSEEKEKNKISFPDDFNIIICLQIV